MATPSSSIERSIDRIFPTIQTRRKSDRMLGARIEPSQAVNKQDLLVFIWFEKKTKHMAIVLIDSFTLDLSY